MGQRYGSRDGLGTVPVTSLNQMEGMSGTSSQMEGLSGTCTVRWRECPGHAQSDRGNVRDMHGQMEGMFGTYVVRWRECSGHTSSDGGNVRDMHGQMEGMPGASPPGQRPPRELPHPLYSTPFSYRKTLCHTLYM